jgi:hypothetical protein
MKALASIKETGADQRSVTVKQQLIDLDINIPVTRDEFVLKQAKPVAKVKKEDNVRPNYLLRLL